MSILNAFVTPELALIGVDSEAMLPNGDLQQVCKIVVNPVLSAVVGFRGLDLMQMAAAPVFSGWKGTFDALAEYVPELIRLCEEHCINAHGQPKEQLITNVVLAGFSESIGAMALHAYQRTKHTQPIEHHRSIPQFYAPYWGDDHLKSLGICADRKGMETLAREQCRKAREERPTDFACGGRFFIAEARRNSIRIEQAFEFPPRPEKVG